MTSLVIYRNIDTKAILETIILKLKTKESGKTTYQQTRLMLVTLRLKITKNSVPIPRTQKEDCQMNVTPQNSV